MNYFNQKGNIILFAVVAITAISVLGTGIYFMTTTATFSGLSRTGPINWPLPAGTTRWRRICLTQAVENLH
jgi:hypothetical protein